MSEPNGKSLKATGVEGAKTRLMLATEPAPQRPKGWKGWANVIEIEDEDTSSSDEETSLNSRALRSGAKYAVSSSEIQEDGDRATSIDEEEPRGHTRDLRGPTKPSTRSSGNQIQADGEPSADEETEQPTRVLRNRSSRVSYALEDGNPVSGNEGLQMANRATRSVSKHASADPTPSKPSARSQSNQISPVLLRQVPPQHSDPSLKGSYDADLIMKNPRGEDIVYLTADSLSEISDPDTYQFASDKPRMIVITKFMKFHEYYPQKPGERDSTHRRLLWKKLKIPQSLADNLSRVILGQYKSLKGKGVIIDDKNLSEPEYHPSTDKWLDASWDGELEYRDTKSGDWIKGFFPWAEKDKHQSKKNIRVKEFSKKKNEGLKRKIHLDDDLSADSPQEREPAEEENDTLAMMAQSAQSVLDQGRKRKKLFHRVRTTRADPTPELHSTIAIVASHPISPPRSLTDPPQTFTSEQKRISGFMDQRRDIAQRVEEQSPSSRKHKTPYASIYESSDIDFREFQAPDNAAYHPRSRSQSKEMPNDNEPNQIPEGQKQPNQNHQNDKELNVSLLGHKQPSSRQMESPTTATKSESPVQALRSALLSRGRPSAEIKQLREQRRQAIATYNECIRRIQASQTLEKPLIAAYNALRAEALAATEVFMNNRLRRQVAMPPIPNETGTSNAAVSQPIDKEWVQQGKVRKDEAEQKVKAQQEITRSLKSRLIFYKAEMNRQGEVIKDVEMRDKSDEEIMRELLEFDESFIDVSEVESGVGSELVELETSEEEDRIGDGSNESSADSNGGGDGGS